MAEGILRSEFGTWKPRKRYLPFPETPPLAWSPDGKQLAYRQEMGTKILNASQGYRHADTFEYRLELGPLARR